MSKTRCLQLKDDILGGDMLSIDPTSGTMDRATGSPSVAGWAYFKEGQLIESGVINIVQSINKETRLRNLLSTLSTDFDEIYDVLAMEDIPIARRRGSFNTSQTLIQACGVYVAGLSGSLVEINSNTWQAVARRIGGWEKGDESDAQYIGLAAIAFASGYSQSMTEKRKTDFIGELVAEYDFWNLPGIIEHWNITEK